jgi:AbrB family looped-hinge helix DNA binding protein
MSTLEQPLSTKVAVAKITSKGQITIPAEVRSMLGLKPGDKVAFEQMAQGSIFVRKADEFPFDRFRGMGTGVPELETGPDSIIQYIRDLRGHDEFDHLD